MEKLKLDVYIVDKHSIIPKKAVYLRDKRLIEIRKGLRQIVSERFIANPDDIYALRRGRKIKYVCFVDNATRKSIGIEKARKILVQREDGKTEVKEDKVIENVEVGETVKIHSDEELDGELKNILDYFVDEAFYRSIASRRKLPTLYILMCLIAGVGVYTIFVTILRALGVNV